MGRTKGFLLGLGAGAILLLGGCYTEETTVSVIDEPVSSSDEIVSVVVEDSTLPFTYTHDLGSSPKDLYFLFNNATSTRQATVPTVASAQVAGSQPAAQLLLSAQGLLGQEDNLRQMAKSRGLGLRDLPEAQAYGQELAQKMKHWQENPPTPGQRPSWAGERRAVAVGDSQKFYDTTSSYSTVTGTLRSQVTDGSITLNIWVDSYSWGTCSKKHCLTQSMVDTFAAKFLASGSNNDIYDYVTNLYGKPWGSHSSTTNSKYLIDSTADATIDVLFFDIDSDNSDTGGVLGYYWAKDNIKSAYQTGSNERLIFYMDSVLTAAKDGDTWEVTDYWPAEMLSTLAHEFQHMIHFYQKSVLLTDLSDSEAWINEMISMVTEDLVASKIGVDGPRGIAYSDGSAGSSGNTEGRIPYYNYYTWWPVSYWPSSSSVLISYSSAYSFGAYLARNYGGAELMQKMVQSKYTDITAVTQAVQDMGYSETAASLLTKWGIAVFLSDQTGRDAGYRFNEGTWFDSSLNGVTYSLGSINFYNFTGGGVTGPQPVSISSLKTFSYAYEHANLMVSAAQDSTGKISKKVSFPTSLTMTAFTH